MKIRHAGLTGTLVALCVAWSGLGQLACADEALVKAAADPNGWAMYGRGYDNTRYSPLKQINTGNVGQLKLAFSMQLGSLRSNESSPIVVGDTMYVSTSWGPKYVYALDARTGVRKWTYEPEIPDDVLQFACCDVNSRGVTFAAGKIFVGRLDGKLAAVDATTGKELWVASVVDYKQGSVITSPPIVVKNLVITGFGGGEYGARGSLQAYDIESGKQVWKTWTVPGPGEPNNDTWKGDSWQHGGGVAWLVGSYDPKTNTVFYGTSNPGPWNSVVRSTGDSNYGKLTNLYTSSTIALDADTGRIKWWVQSTPQDAWDYDGVNEVVLADLAIGGTRTPVYMKADRNGFFYVVNRENGKIISAEKFVPTNWAEKIDVATGMPKEIPDKRPGPKNSVKGVCPNLIGGKNWQPMSYSPDTGLVYIPSNNVCMDWGVSEVNYKKGVFYLGAEFPTHPGPGGYMGELIAWDPVAQKKVWGVQSDLPFNGGTLTTAGGLTFWGDLHGVFRAFDAKNGKELWSASLGSGIGAGPISYSVDGKQYIAIVVGRTAAIPAFLGDVGKKMVAATPEGGALFVFTH
ncbi:MAG TPA: PQQ-dependent dehydrogenase, methanol/ethanol family [Burkholderiaceae bacterium]|nr:PQQ-dependent dehydrogenase, methanol/ethanol family [Burkholderiaceae bacterium]